MWDGGGGKFHGTKRYEGVRFNVISVTKRWVGDIFSEKKRFVTLEWHGTLPFITTLYIHACVSHLFQKEFLDEFTRLKLEFGLLPVSILKVQIVAFNKICGNLNIVGAQSLICSNNKYFEVRKIHKLL